MMLKFHIVVKTERAVAVGSSAVLANQPPPPRGNDTRNWLALVGIRCVAGGSAGGGK